MELEPDTPPLADDGETLGTVTFTNEPTGDLQCQVCQLPLTYSGRGPKPKYCAEHRKQPSTGTRTRTTNLDSLVAQIGEFYRGAGVVVGMFQPTAFDGQMIAANADTLAVSWKPLMERDPKVRKVWEKITTGGGWGTVVMAHMPLVLMIAAGHGLSLPGMQRQMIEPEVTPNV